MVSQCPINTLGFFYFLSFVSYLYIETLHTGPFLLYCSSHGVFIYCILDIAHCNVATTVHCILIHCLFLHWILDIAHCNISSAAHIILGLCVWCICTLIAFVLLCNAVLFGLLTGFALTIVISCF